MSRKNKRGSRKGAVRKTEAKIEELYDDIQLPYSEDAPKEAAEDSATEGEVHSTDEAAAGVAAEGGVSPNEVDITQENKEDGEEILARAQESAENTEAPEPEKAVEADGSADDDKPENADNIGDETVPEAGTEESVREEEAQVGTEAISEPENADPEETAPQAISSEEHVQGDEQAPAQEEILEEHEHGELEEEYIAGYYDDYDYPGEHGAAARVKERKRKKKLFKRYSIIVVPENHANVRSYKLSILPLLIVILILLSAIGVIVLGMTYGVNHVKDLRNQVLALNANLVNVTNANVLLEADKEELENELREANARISTSTYVQEQTESAQAMDHIPSGLPLDGQVSTPSEYTDEHQYITFTTGMGTKIIATGAGTVTSIVDDNNLGHVMQVDHGNGYISVYYSPSDPLVKEGDSVIRGTTLYLVQGDTETLTYQILYNGKYIDPATIMRIDG